MVAFGVKVFILSAIELSSLKLQLEIVLHTSKKFEDYRINEISIAWTEITKN